MLGVATGHPSEITSNRIRIETFLRKVTDSNHKASSEITSNRIRIETEVQHGDTLKQLIIWNNIQQNKDWNLVDLTFDATDSGIWNNIQQNKDWNTDFLVTLLEIFVIWNNIQQNKDWNR